MVYMSVIVGSYNYDISAATKAIFLHAVKWKWTDELRKTQ